MRDYQYDCCTESRRPETPLNPEFAKSIPTNGFGEIEATALASMSSYGAPRPQPITPKPARKVCRIFSPVCTPRAKAGGDRLLVGLRPSAASAAHPDARPHTADAATYRPRGGNESTPKGAFTGTDADSINNSRRAGISNADEPGRRLGRRPMTSDSTTRIQQQQQQRGHERHDTMISNTTNIGSKYGGGVGVDGRLRPSTTGGGRRQASDCRRYDEGGGGLSNTPTTTAIDSGWDAAPNEEKRCWGGQEHRMSPKARRRNVPLVVHNNASISILGRR